MSFLSIKFSAFFAVLLFSYSRVKKMSHQQWMLVIASYIYYASFSWKFCIILLLNSFFIWGITKARGYYNKRLGLQIGVVIEVLLLAVFKYFNFFIEAFSHEDTYQLILPVGLSFYVFSAISYLVDFWRRDIKGNVYLREILLYTCFFPKIVSGPITKAKDFFPQFRENHTITKENLSYGMQRFIWGIVQKSIIADRLDLAVNSVYRAPFAYSGFSLMVASVTYSLQIYFDFAGYSDMAIGLAHVFGYDLGENFNLPYLSKSFSEFWKRWHISLSSWLKDYVYIPLGGSKKGKRHTYYNLLIVMIISGLWHGSSLNYLLWGVLHGLSSCIEKFVKEKNANKRRNRGTVYIRNVLLCIVNFCIVNVFWIFFRIEDIKDAIMIIHRMLCWSPGITYVYSYTLVFAVLLVILEIIAVIKFNSNNPIVPVDLKRFRWKIVFCLQVVAIVAFGYFGNTNFIYSMF